MVNSTELGKFLLYVNSLTANDLSGIAKIKGKHSYLSAICINRQINSINVKQLVKIINNNYKCDTIYLSNFTLDKNMISIVKKIMYHCKNITKICFHKTAILHKHIDKLSKIFRSNRSNVRTIIYRSFVDDNKSMIRCIRDILMTTITELLIKVDNFYLPKNIYYLLLLIKVDNFYLPKNIYYLLAHIANKNNNINTLNINVFDHDMHLLKYIALNNNINVVYTGSRLYIHQLLKYNSSIIKFISCYKSKYINSICAKNKHNIMQKTILLSHLL